MICNLYAQTKSQDAMRQVFRDVLEDREELIDAAGNLAPASRIFPDYAAPIIRRSKGRDWTLTTARWGMPTPPVYLAGKRADPGVTNIRNVNSSHWRRWLGIEHRYLVPFTSFSELDARPGAPRNHPVWFALGQDRPLAFFAGIRTEWTSIRKLKEGEVTAQLLGFLTCEANTEVHPVHPKAMPVILTRPDEWRCWLTADTSEALKLQRPLANGLLEIVAEGTRADPA